jgi:hypothetical protein
MIVVRNVRICIKRANAASVEIGAGFASTTTSPRTSVISNCPRGGSGSRNAKSAAMITGTPRMKNAHRHPDAPPAVAAIAPTASGDITATSRPAVPVTAPSRPRTPIG